MAHLTAFEIAVALGDNASIKCFNEVLKDISLTDRTISENAISIVLKYDQGATLEYLKYFTVIQMYDCFTSKDWHALLLRGC